ncbi:hypothetical protein FIV42_03895 [Persicimonas caeni]|uniref:Protein kinase domain-containing protein n=1 Tax=Persicimonas caeni TaxID=2292766 RepID=A0A4Y6PNP6_PERCE|nr:protein kinase [Persicimonas caeni]QDG49914.1 hypothetical protein FIV42_03895 [Persicimonas caeni]QED31135.1 protein kinase [Persicimonas caeni]
MTNLQGGTLALEHRYDVLERADRHGFITLYRGRQDPFDKQVWVKAYDGLVDVGAGLELFDRLKQASQISSALDADGVLRIIDYGELEGGIPFVISERTDAQPLANHLVEEGTLSAEATSTLLTRLAQILEQAHQKGVAHGSISPRWIFVDGDRYDEAALGHFQLALTVREILDTESAVMTAEAVSAFPPEMFAQSDTDDEPPSFEPVGDVWAMGVLAYVALVGVHPFFEDEVDASEGILRLRNDAPRPLSELGVDPAISDVIDRALQKDPSARFSSVTELADTFAHAVGIDRALESSEKAAPEAVEETSQEALSSPVNENPASPSPIARRSLDEPAERPPGPSDRLMTLVIVLLVLTNLAWLFYVTGFMSDDTASQTSPNKPASTSVVTDG